MRILEKLNEMLLGKPFPWEIPNKRLLMIKRGGVTIALVELPEERGGGQFASAHFDPDCEWPIRDDPAFRAMGTSGLYAGWWSGMGTQVYPAWSWEK